MGNADPRVRLRVFNYLRTSGTEIGMANLVASRCVGAMVQPGKLPESVIAISAAAISSSPTLDHMDETKSFALLEPRAEPYEAWPAKSSGSTSPMTATGGKMASRLSSGMRTPTAKFSTPLTGGLRSPIGGTGTTEFGLIEPLVTRREITARQGSRLSRMQLQAYTGEIVRTMK